ncbi:hypothetical protein HN51_047447 [Arachis hypogaea]|uniref:MHD1 domain-containing protein n=1 Tax=Arachis hypogaea TaxID=3818 RepID=A0A445AGV4_ARAHY|nr:uncharacterized protein LOC107625256 isoform X1 [Arachis ipaensis]XP_025632874.1 protein unc-13 homolog [Arachis hypogaea]QHO23811.1 uncharacterized protein DS421_12g366750 [Arachis hypogaea]RYR25642.1 hypothetical protein Ahy_B02g059504 [Arachis hypogaea]
MGQQTHQDSYPGSLPSALSVNEIHYHHHHHHHHHHSHIGIGQISQLGQDLEASNLDQNLDPSQFELPEKEDNGLPSPFMKLEGLSQDDIRESAYEIFFTACRSSPGFGGRHVLSIYASLQENEAKASHVVMSPTSKVKRALGLKMIKRSPSRRMVSGGVAGIAASSSPKNGSNSPMVNHNMLRPRRPMTSAEIMRQQMRVTEHNDYRLRKTLTRTLVGQAGKRADTIILPLELLRHVKPSEFSDSTEYHMWQRRQLKILELGLLQHPSVYVEKTNTFAMRLRDIIRNSESKPIDIGKNSDTLRTLSNSVVSLAWRGPNGAPADVCHWVDGFPLNVHLYTSLLQAIFDIRDETLVLDEVDELLELMKKTWPILGINKAIHNVCFTWVLFQQFVVTGEVESDLLCASHAMLGEVNTDAKKEKDSLYIKLLTSVMSAMQSWSERRLLNYHNHFERGTLSQIENLLPMVLSVSKVLGEDQIISDGERGEKADKTIVDMSGDRIESCIRSSVRSAFQKILEEVNTKTIETEIKADLSDILLRLAQETEALALKERETYTPTLKKWLPTAGAIAALTLHDCYGQILKQYLNEVNALNSETVRVLLRAGKLEKTLVQMMVEGSLEGEEKAKAIVKEMMLYEVDTIIWNLLRKWIHESLHKGKEALQNAKETETWNPKSKAEPIAQSAVELVKLAKTIMEQFFQIPIGITEDIVQELANGLENLLQDYIMFVSACGTKQSYVPVIPSLTRCNRNSKFSMFLKKGCQCGGGGSSEADHISNVTKEGHNPRPSTSRGTQRLYIRLNTLFYLLTHINSLEKTLSQNPVVLPSTRHPYGNRRRSYNNGSYFEKVLSSLPTACQYVAEVAAYRLIFLDSDSVFYESLYVGDAANARIRPALRTLKQNITLMTTLLTDKAQSLALKEVMKASFEAFLMVLLAGGNSRAFTKSDYHIVSEDFESLNRVFCLCGEGLIAESVMDTEAAIVEGIIALMGQSTEQLIDDFNIASCETSVVGVNGHGYKSQVPPTTGRWHRSDPNTILRVLCHRNDRTANLFLKRTFQLPKRRS